VSSAGRRVALIECFRADAAELGLPLRVLAADANPDWSAACRVCDAAYRVPRCTTEEFILALLALCKREQVDLVIPTIDPELEPLAAARPQFQALGTRVAVSSVEMVRMARDKFETARWLAEHGIPSPKTVRLAELLAQPEHWSWPVLLKPVNGSSSIGLVTASTPEQARALADENREYIAQNLLRGREYTVNLFFSEQGALRAAVPHWRCEVRAGEVSKGVTERHKGLMKVADRLEQVLTGASGALCFQAIVGADDQPVVFEINARFGGGYPLAHRAGARFSKWLLQEIVGLPWSEQSGWEEGIMMLRYDGAVFRKQNVLP
jgi:carbamoyl-phosphate synthase large subunit